MLIPYLRFFCNFASKVLSFCSMEENQIFRHEGKVAKSDRSFVLFFTGLSGSGKSTVACEVEKLLHDRGMRTVFLDGDNLRAGLNRDLSFSAEDRAENIRRAGEVAKLFYDAGVNVLASFIAPYTEDRDKVRALFPGSDFVEIYVKCDIEECKKRDPKKLYLKAEAGEITDFTGVTAPYEDPENAEIVLESDQKSVDALASEVLTYLDGLS